jgi:chromate transporter
MTDSAPALAPPAPAAPPGPAALFTGFLTLGLMGFGGVLPLARHMLVEQRRWLTAAEFTELLGLCQFLPGGNIINLAVAVGMRFAGVTGAVAALAGLIAVPTVVLIGLGTVYDRFSNDPHVRHLFTGLAAAAGGLVIAMAARIAWPIRREPAVIAVAVLCFVAIAVLRWPLLPTMALMSALGMAVAWWKARAR